MSAAPGQVYFGQYASEASFAAPPSHVSCWALLDATPHDWAASSALVTNAWADLVPNTYTDYCLGENFTIVADEEYPLITTEDRPLTVPPDSGVSTP